MNGRFRFLLAALVALTATALLVPALAAPLGAPAPDPIPSIVFIARADNPIDALAAGAVAGQVGGVVLLTAPTELQEDTRQALLDRDPELVVLAGGTAAVSAEVFEAIQSLLPDADVVRKSGASRFVTAAELATLLDDLGIAGPVVAGAQREGDVWIGGTLTATDLVVPGGLDADTLGGKSADQFAAAPAVTTGTYRCTGDDFFPTDPANTDFVREVSLALTSHMDNTFYRCVVRLPDGATITALRVRIRDEATGTGFLAMDLGSTSATDSATGHTLASIPVPPVSSTPGDRVLVADTTIADFPEATTSLDFNYYVWFGIANSAGTTRVGVYYADVEYTVPAVPGTPVG
jgi:hypothetical protein